MDFCSPLTIEMFSEQLYAWECTYVYHPLTIWYLAWPLNLMFYTGKLKRIPSIDSVLLGMEVLALNVNIKDWSIFFVQ